METLRKHIDTICIPDRKDAWNYKQECLYTYDTPQSPDGVFISLSSYLCFNAEHAAVYAKKTGNKVFLHVKHEFKRVRSTEALGYTPIESLEKLAPRTFLSHEYGDAMETHLFKYYSICVMPERQEFAYPSMELPQMLNKAVDMLLQFLEEIKREALKSAKSKEVLPKPVYAVTQIDNPRTVSPVGLKCEKCQFKWSLWLNLSDGAIFCGRHKHNGIVADHAEEHAKSVKYPSVIRLRSINGKGNAEVFSYRENRKVADSLLREHLLHFGINVGYKPTRYTPPDQWLSEWLILEDLKSILSSATGPASKGLQAVGSLSYMHSIMQVVLHIPDFKNAFSGTTAMNTFHEFPPKPATDFNIQLCKLTHAFWSDNNKFQTLDTWMFQQMLAKHNFDYHSSELQDAYEYYMFFLELLKNNHIKQDCPSEALKFCTETRYECLSTGKVRYVQQNEYCLSLPIPLERANNHEEVLKAIQLEEDWRTKSAKVRLKMPFRACLEEFFMLQVTEQFHATATDAQTKANKTLRLASMPDYLMLRLCKFNWAEDWTPSKLYVEVDVPETLDLNEYRAEGLQPDEVLLPAEVKDLRSLALLMSYGFSKRHAKMALEVNDDNEERATNWLFMHAKKIEQDSKAEEAEESRRMYRDGVGLYKLKAFVTHLGSLPNNGAYVAYVQCNSEWLIYTEEGASKIEKPPINLGYMYVYERNL